MNNTYKKIKAAVLLVIAALSLVYYGICVVYAWAGVSWLWIWLLLSGFCLVRSGLIILEVKGLALIKLPRWMSIVYRAMVLAALAVFINVETDIITAMNTDAVTGLDYIIVLGAAVRGDKPTSPMLLRIERAAEYLLENPDTVAVASGGQGDRESITESECIRRYLTEYGIDEERIIIEDLSKDTVDNIKNSLALIDNDSHIGLVTSSFHMKRAQLIAEKTSGLKLAAVPAKTLLPLGIHYTVREFFGIVELYLRGIA